MPIIQFNSQNYSLKYCLTKKKKKKSRSNKDKTIYFKIFLAIRMSNRLKFQIRHVNISVAL